MLFFENKEEEALGFGEASSQNDFFGFREVLDFFCKKTSAKFLIILCVYIRL
jgi:hypothetical protein